MYVCLSTIGSSEGLPESQAASAALTGVARIAKRLELGTTCE